MSEIDEAESLIARLADEYAQRLERGERPDSEEIAQLSLMGNTNPVILNVSHLGDATTEEMSLPKQERMIEALRDPDNWLASGQPDAIVFSGGGGDIAGNPIHSHQYPRHAFARRLGQ